MSEGDVSEGDVNERGVSKRDVRDRSDDATSTTTNPRVLYGTCAGLVGFTLFYTLPIYARLPRTFYDPVARRWFFAASSTPIPMGYIGQIVWGIAGALVAAGLAMMLASRHKRAPSERAFALGAAWTLTAIAIVIGYFTWNNWP